MLALHPTIGYVQQPFGANAGLFGFFTYMLDIDSFNTDCDSAKPQIARIGSTFKRSGGSSPGSQMQSSLLEGLASGPETSGRECRFRFCQIARAPRGSSGASCGRSATGVWFALQRLAMEKLSTLSGKNAVA